MSENNNVRAAWLSTRVFYEWQRKQFDRSTGETVPVPQKGSESIESLQIKPESDWALMVEKHRKAVADFVVRNPQYHITGFRNEVCGDVKIPDEARSPMSRFVRKGPVYEAQCWRLAEESTLPETEALSSLFRSAEIVVDLLGPVEKNNAAVAEPQTPTSQPTPSGTNAVQYGNPRETTYLP